MAFLAMGKVGARARVRVLARGADYELPPAYRREKKRQGKKTTRRGVRATHTLLMPPASSFAFKTDDSVLAYHGPLIHEATVRECAARDKPNGQGKINLYLVHYDNWNSHWDEWVPESRVLKADDEARAIQKERIKDFQRAHKRKQRVDMGANSAACAGSGGSSKKAKGAGEASEESLCAELRESLRLPHGMKLKLIEDWERITREKKLVPLPRTPTVSELLNEFMAAKARRTSHERLYGEVCDGLRSYFNQALPTILLYKYERKQHRDNKEGKGLSPVDIYGAEHLLRLFVKLPELLAKCNMQREHMTVLVAKLTELLKFMQGQKAKYFVADYQLPDEAYLMWWGQNEHA